MNNIIEIENLTFYCNNNLILNDMNLYIKTGTFTTLLGNDNVGKSILAKIINGLINTEAKIKINGLNLNEKNKKKIRNIIGYIPFDMSDSILTDTVLDELLISSDNKRIEELNYFIKEFNLSEIIYENPRSLSSGQKQLISIISQILKKNKLIILDDSLSMLDNLTKDKILKILKKINKEKKITILNITNDSEEALYGDRIAILLDGKILVNDIKEEVNKNCFQYIVILNSKGNFLAANVNGVNLLTDITVKLIRLFKRKIYHEKINFSNKYFREILDSEKIYSLHIYFLEKENVSVMADVLRRKFKDQVELIVTDRGIEITAKGITKATGIRTILSKLNIDEHDAIFVGDGGNDVPVFESFENTFGMQNGQPDAIKKAKNIINGFGEIEEYLNE